MFLTNNNIGLNKEALVDDTGARVSYGDLNADCNLLRTSIKDRSFFLILADKSIETIRLYYACMANKMVVLLLNPESPLEYIKNYLELYRPQYVFAPKKLPDYSFFGRYNMRVIIMCFIRHTMKKQSCMMSWLCY